MTIAKKFEVSGMFTKRCEIAALWAIGNASLLQSIPLAFFCSVKCPGHLILKTHDLANRLKESGIAIISGFHSPVEKEVLTNLLRGDQPILICPARSIHNMRIPKAWKAPIQSGQVLVLSPFEEELSRVTSANAVLRNQFVAAMSKQVFVAYAEPGGKTEQFCKDIIEWGTQLLTFNTSDNQNLLSIGALNIEEANIGGQDE